MERVKITDKMTFSEKAEEFLRCWGRAPLFNTITTKTIESDLKLDVPDDMTVFDEARMVEDAEKCGICDPKKWGYLTNAGTALACRMAS